MDPRTQADITALRVYLASLWRPVTTFFEGRFVWLALVPISIWLYIDRALVRTWIGLLLGLIILAGLALQIRKVVAPRIDLQEYAERAKEDPMAAAIVVLALVLYMSVLIVCGVLWLGGLKG